MWQGALGPVIQLDTIDPQEGLYGLGPLSYLQGELLIKDGIAYVARVVSDSSMRVERSPELTAPFFVYTHVQDWEVVPLPDSVQDLASLEAHIHRLAQHRPEPFPFQLRGLVQDADIHIQNLAPGSKVSNPQEAHQGQVNYTLQALPVDIVGFYSTSHQGVFTHHDSFVHLHLITRDESQMGHLDALHFSADQMQLLLPAH